MSDALPKLGLRLPNSGPFASADAIVRVAERAEALAYHAVWVHDHVSWPRHELTHFATGSLEACADQDPNLYESVQTLAFLGGRVPRVHLGIAGLILPLRDPRVLGKQLATLDRLTGGRVIVGMGSGAKEHDFEVMGLAWEDRGKRMTEYLRVLRAMFAEAQPVTFAGERVSFQEGTFYPTPRGIRIWVAGRSGPALARAVQYADGLLTHVLAPEEYAALDADLVRRLEEAKRDPATFDRSLEVFSCVAATHEEAVAISARSLGRRAEDAVAANLVGTAEEIRAKLARYRAAGVTHVELRMICHTVDQLEEMAERVSVACGLRDAAAIEGGRAR